MFKTLLLALSICVILISNSYAFENPREGKILILPIFSDGDQAILWHNSNYWMMAWHTLLENHPELPIILPEGDMGDRAAIDIKDIANMDTKKLLFMMDKYASSSVIVAKAVFDDYTVDVYLSTLDPSHLSNKRLTYNRLAGESIAGLLYSAANDSALKLSKTYKIPKAVETVLPLDDYKKITPFLAKIEVGNISDWLRVKKILEKIKMIKPFATKEITYDNVEVELYHEGNIEEFRRLLDAGGIKIFKQDNQWYLKVK